MHTKTIAELSSDLAKKEYSSTELTEYTLRRIEQLNPQLNSFITITAEHALNQAKQADEKRAKGHQHPLLGIPFAHKDIFCTQGIKTTCASKMLDNFIAPYDATVVEKCNQTGLVMVGKTNMDEFAMGSSSENSFYGRTKNPWDLSCVPGGSSGGSAAAVAARLVPAATGTDTGGSIRQPASFTGITGLKPTYGLVSRYGMIAFASSLDQGGIFALSAEDTALILQAIAGFDEKDSTSIEHTIPDYASQLNQSVKGLRIGLPSEFFTQDLDPAINQLIQTAIYLLEKEGAIIKEVSLPNAYLSVPAYYVIAPAECSSNLARYDGVRYGHRAENPTDLNDLYKRSRSEGFGEEVKRRIIMGTYMLSAGYYDAYYIKAQKVRRLINNDFQTAFNEVDAILAPTTPTTAFKIGAKDNDPVSMYLSDIYTIAVNLAGLPGMSIPVGFIDNLPIGMQLIGNHFCESTLLRLAHYYQQLTDWHKQIPSQFI